jgi:hypothetical protein
MKDKIKLNFSFMTLTPAARAELHIADIFLDPEVSVFKEAWPLIPLPLIQFD